MTVMGVTKCKEVNDANGAFAFPYLANQTYLS